MAAAAEREASERAVDEASRTAVAQAVEDELEAVSSELMLLKVGAWGHGCRSMQGHDHI